MGVITIELEELEVAALIDLLYCLKSFNEGMPRDFSVIIQHALTDSVKAGTLETDTAFEVFGHVSRVTADVAYYSGQINQRLKTFSAALESL